MKKIAVILFNLGGPDNLEAVKPFLFNLFNDKAIINYPQPFRYLLAKLISNKRTAAAKEIYKKIGEKSPLLDNVNIQARAIEVKFKDSIFNLKCYPVMRYWHPFASEVIPKIKNFNPEKIILLPLYPQYSTTTTGSSINNWQKSCKLNNLLIDTNVIGYYPDNDGFCHAVIKLMQPYLNKYYMDKNIVNNEKPRILFSAHGLPQKIIDSGDPYQNHVKNTVAAIIKQLIFINSNYKNLDYKICYQSRVGKLEWIKPYLDDEIIQAGIDKKSIIIVPIAFTSENSETLVELDIEYAKLAITNNIPSYMRVPTVSVEVKFIDGLTELIKKSINDG